jgi:hypothetical protein
LLPGDHNRALTAPEIPRDARLSFSYIVEALVVNHLTELDAAASPFSLTV